MWRPVRARPGTGAMGTVYLLAFDRPVGHAWHYRGWTGDPLTRTWRLGLRSDAARLPKRLRRHAQGRGARLPAVARGRGIGWTLAWFAEGDRNEERRKKNSGSYSRRDCMFCATGQPHPGEDTT
jgi:hypothetical protein